MVNKSETSLPEAIDRTLRDFKVNDHLIRGVAIIFADDLKKIPNTNKIPPVVPKGTKSDEMYARLKSSNR